MARVRNRARTRRLGALPIVLLILIVAGAAIGTMYLVNKRWPWESSSVAARDAKDVADGQVAVPLSLRQMTAYTTVELAHLVDAKSQSAKLVRMSEQQAKDRGYITDVRQLIGRVMAHDKTAGYAFTEKDFLPRGSLASPSSGIEAGYRGVPVQVGQIEGLRALKRNDRFDLVGVRPQGGNVKPDRDVNVSAEVLSARADRDLWDAPTKVLVNNAKVIVPAPERSSSNSGTRDEVLIAVPEAEVADFFDALRLGAKINCVMRSGQAGVLGGALPQGEAEVATESVEVWSGAKKKVEVLPARPNGAQAANVGGEEPK